MKELRPVGQGSGSPFNSSKRNIRLGTTTQNQGLEILFIEKALPVLETTALSHGIQIQISRKMLLPVLETTTQNHGRLIPVSSWLATLNLTY